MTFYATLPYFSAYITVFYFLSKNNPNNLAPSCKTDLDLRLFRKENTHIIAKFYWTRLVIISNSREKKTPSYSRRNTVSESVFLFVMVQISEECASLRGISKFSFNMDIFHLGTIKITQL